MTWQQAMAKNNEYIVKMLKDFQKQMQEHHSKVTQIESGVNELARRQSKMGEMMVSAPKGSEEINIEDEEPEQQQEQPRGFPKKEEETKPAQEKKDPNPRSGNYNPEDVSIENVFYFGNKK